MRKNRKAATKQFALSILSDEPKDDIVEDKEKIETEKIIEITPRQEAPNSKLAELAERIRLNIDTEAETATKPVKKMKKNRLF